jgi:hypothetical protein
MTIKKGFLRPFGFGREVTMVEDCRCPLCAERVDEEEFRSEVFMREFKTIGLCQGYLDTVFGYKVA